MQENLYINTRFLGGWDLLSPNREPAWVLWSKETTAIFFGFFVAHYVHISLFAFVSGCSSVNAQPNNPWVRVFSLPIRVLFLGVLKKCSRGRDRCIGLYRPYS